MRNVNWEHHTAVTNTSGRLVKYMDGNFVIQVLRQPTRKDALLVLVLNREGSISQVVIGDHLGHSDHKAVEFTILLTGGKEIATLQPWK